VVSLSALGVMITIRRMALGAGFRYLMESGQPLPAYLLSLNRSS
jgi:hypothetical protein